MSDHGSGPRAFSDPVVDIADMYVFPSPGRSGSLVLALNVFPWAGPAALFSDVVDYRFRVRSTGTASSGAAFAVGEKEYTFSCRFTAPVEQESDGELVQEGTWTPSTGHAVAFHAKEDRGG